MRAEVTSDDLPEVLDGLGARCVSRTPKPRSGPLVMARVCGGLPFRLPPGSDLNVVGSEQASRITATTRRSWLAAWRGYHHLD